MDDAPTFPDVLQQFRKFLEKHRLIDGSGQRLTRFCFCSDGPYDIRDFVVKQCFMSKASDRQLVPATAAARSTDLRSRRFRCRCGSPGTLWTYAGWWASGMPS